MPASRRSATLRRDRKDAHGCQQLFAKIVWCDIDPTVIKATLVNGYLFAPWLVKPFHF